MEDISQQQHPVVFVVDDDPSMRAEIASMLRSAGLAVQAFASGGEFLAEPALEAPSCLVLDVDLPGLGGFELQRQLTARGVRLPTIFITSHPDIPMSVRAMKAGAIEFLPKPFCPEHLLEAVKQALQMSRALRMERAQLDQLRQRFQGLTPRERQVLKLVVSGMLNKQIASELGISEVTVKIHRGHVMQKTGAASVVDLVRMADRMMPDRITTS